MDDLTRQAYATNAREISRRHLATAGGLATHFARAFEAGARILDVGAGSGRDLALLVSEGHVAYGVEPVAEMRQEAARSNPQIAGRLIEGELPDGLPQGAALAKLGGPFDAVVCSAVLQHLPRAELFDAVFALRRVLRPGGRALISIPSARPGLDAEGRDEMSRLFNGVQPGELELLFQRIGFRTLAKEESGDSLGRARVRWTTMLFERSVAEEEPGAAEGGSEAGIRPLDRIEAVLRRDRKVASYKLALLRAFTDIASHQPRRVQWRADAWVGIPMDAVVDLWIEYYWPIFSSTLFLPQMNGESMAEGHKLGFARELEALRERFSKSGGLPGFISQWRGENLDVATGALLKKLRKKLERVIREGPVHYAGRSTSAASRSIFSYDSERRLILVGEPLWQEIALMSHWVRDSLLIRWAEFCGRLAASVDRTGNAHSRVMERALRMMLQPIVPERDTQLARKIFSNLPDLRCVWRGSPLSGRRFDVDHAIPYSLWQSNDLWNLLPASSSANNDKRDKLPTRRLLRMRRGAIVDCWQRLHCAAPRRFEHDLGLLLGRRRLDFDGAFDAFGEAIERTALERGCQRWNG